MDPYPWLRFAHLVGLMLISAGLIGVFVADMRSRQVRDLRLFAQAFTFVAVFYDGLVVPGALPGRTPVLEVAGCRGYELGAERASARRRMAAEAGAAAAGSGP